MLKRSLNIAVSVVIALLLLLNGTAHEFLHSFTGHEDTTDCIHTSSSPGGAAFEKQHHHCDFLDLQSPVFLTSSLSFHFHPPCLHNDYFVLLAPKNLCPEREHTALRGPPSC